VLKGLENLDLKSFRLIMKTKNANIGGVRVYQKTIPLL